MIFRDRTHAGAVLAERLAPYRGTRPLVVGIPRGGVLVAEGVARALASELDVVLVAKLRHPHEPEVAIGAVDEGGASLLHEEMRRRPGLTEDYLGEEIRTRLQVLRRKRRACDAVRRAADPAGRTVIVVDDGLATGATMEAALRSLRRRGAARLVAAVPIASPAAAEALAPLADEVICVEQPPAFRAVSQGYEQFDQTDDAAVLRVLAACAGADRLAAVLFDFDGVIADTEPLHYRAFQEILAPEQLAYSWEQYLEHYVGFDDRDAFRHAYRVAGRSLSEERLREHIEGKERVFAGLVRSGALAPYPGLAELLDAMGAAGIPAALCSGARRSDIDTALEAMDMANAFPVLVTAEDVRASKPNPESYRMGVERLRAAFPDRGIEPGSCAAIEDTPAGIASARDAGLRVIAVTHTHPAEPLSAADDCVGDLTGVNLARLAGLL